MRKTLIASLALAVTLGFSANSAGAGGRIDENTRDFTKFTCKDLLARIMQPGCLQWSNSLC